MDKDATYVMERGFQVCEHFKYWVENRIKFVTRAKENSRHSIICERELPKRRKDFVRDPDVTLPDLPTNFVISINSLL